MIWGVNDAGQKASIGKGLVPVAVSLSLLAAATNAQAVLLNDEAQVTVGGVPSMAADNGATSVYASTSDYSATGTAAAAGAGNDSGWMYARAGGNGVFSASGSIQQVVNFTNNTGVAQNYFFDFTISRGGLSAYDDAGASGDYVQAGNTVSITLDGVELFTSSASLRNDDSGVSLTTSGVQLGTYTAGSGSYFWSEYTDTLDLGVFEAGESFTLSYNIFTSADSSIAYQDCGFAGEGYMGDGFVGDGRSFIEFDAEFGTWMCSGSGYSQFGDPNGLSSMPISAMTVTGTPAVAVPEPGTLFLMGGGILGLAVARRRKNRRQ